MYVRHLSLLDFRNYAAAELPLQPGVTTLVGANGQGKTNLVEALGYLSSLSSHRVAGDAPLVRAGAERALVRAGITRNERDVTVEIEITPGKANRARLNRSAVKPREILGVLRSVLFAPEDLALVKGDPDARRRFLDDLLILLAPRFAGVRADYDRALKQRNALLKQASTRSGRGRGRTSHVGSETAGATIESSLDVWDAQLVHLGSDLLAARLFLIRQLAPHVAEAYQTVADGVAVARLGYRGTLDSVLDLSTVSDESAALPTRADLAEAMGTALAEHRRAELERGQTLVGPHRDDLVLTLGELPAKGYASHGESWSFALALRLAAYRLLRRDDGGDPVLILDDVLAELDDGRRRRLADAIVDAEQVLVTAAVPQDIPASLAGERVQVDAGQIVAG